MSTEDGLGKLNPHDTPLTIEVELTNADFPSMYMVAEIEDDLPSPGQGLVDEPGEFAEFAEELPSPDQGLVDGPSVLEFAEELPHPVPELAEWILDLNPLPLPLDIFEPETLDETSVSHPLRRGNRIRKQPVRRGNRIRKQPVRRGNRPRKEPVRYGR